MDKASPSPSKASNILCRRSGVFRQKAPTSPQRLASQWNASFLFLILSYLFACGPTAAGCTAAEATTVVVVTGGTAAATKGNPVATFFVLIVAAMLCDKCSRGNGDSGFNRASSTALIQTSYTGSTSNTNTPTARGYDHLPTIRDLPDMEVGEAAPDLIEPQDLLPALDLENAPSTSAASDSDGIEHGSGGGRFNDSIQHGSGGAQFDDSIVHGSGGALFDDGIEHGSGNAKFDDTRSNGEDSKR